jgi:hypothetical protein
VKVNPTDAALGVKSSNDGIAAFSINNKVLNVRGITEGTATVTVTASRGDLTPVKTTFTVNVKGDTAVSTPIVNETFENQTIGTLPKNWNVVANKNTSALVKDLNGKRVLHLLDNNTDATNNNVFASFPISPAQTGKMAFEYKVLNNDPSVQYIRAILASGGDTTKRSPFPVGKGTIEDIRNKSSPKIMKKIILSLLYLTLLSIFDLFAVSS